MQESSTVPGEGTNQHNKPLDAGEDGSDAIPPNTEELPPIIQDMLDQWGEMLTTMTSLVHWQPSP